MPGMLSDRYLRINIKNCFSSQCRISEKRLSVNDPASTALLSCRLPKALHHNNDDGNDYG